LVERVELYQRRTQYGPQNCNRRLSVLAARDDAKKDAVADRLNEVWLQDPEEYSRRRPVLELTVMKDYRVFIRFPQAARRRWKHETEGFCGIVPLAEECTFPDDAEILG
jgi:hypothetical protein